MLKPIRLLLPIAFLFAFSNNSFAQLSNFEWVKHIGGTNYEIEPGIAIDQQSNCYVTGFFTSPYISFGSYTLNHSSSTGGLEDIFLAKYNAAGSLVWAKQAGGGNIDQSKSIAVDNSSNVYITGSFYGSATFGTVTLTGSGATMFIAKYSSAGDLIWIKQASSSGFNTTQGISLALDGNGNCYVTGEMGNSATTFGNYTLTPFGAVDMFIAKYDPDGNVIWAKNAGGTGVDRSSLVALDDAGNAYITGMYGYNGGNANFDNVSLTNSTNDGSYFMAKYNTSGDAVWAKTVPEGQLVVDGTGNVYQTGSFTDALTIGSFNLVSSGAADIYFAKYNNAGNAVWAKKGGGTGAEYPGSVAIDSDDNIYISGYFSGTADFDNLSVSTTQAGETFLAKYSPSGVINWLQDSTARGEMVFSSSNELYFSGNFSNSITIGNTQLVSLGAMDIFLGKLSIISGISESQTSTLSTYPNPFSTFFQISLTGTAPATATLTDLLGRQVHQQFISPATANNTATITPPANLPSGMYLLQTQQGETIQQTRILKQ